VPAKPALLHELAESDSTSYFSATDLLERGKALSAQASEPSPAPAQEVLPSELEAAPQRTGWLAQFRRASLVRKALAVLLPLLCVVLLAKPVLEKSRHRSASQPSASVAAPSAPAQPTLTSPQPSASVAPLALPRGVTAAHAAADSVATGDFSRAATLYRELSRREPANLAYREAARILSERGAQAQTP
jgi:predicted component of type VI protein secretion system